MVTSVIGFVQAWSAKNPEVLLSVERLSGRLVAISRSYWAGDFAAKKKLKF